MDRSLEHPRDSEETLLAAFAGILPAIPNAGGNRETLYLAKIQGQDVQLPETDRTRTEMYLRAIAEHGSGSPYRTVRITGNDSDRIVVPELVGKTLISAVLYANIYVPELSSYDNIALSLYASPASPTYTALLMDVVTNRLSLSGAVFNSDTGELIFNATLPLGRWYLVYYQ